MEPSPGLLTLLRGSLLNPAVCKDKAVGPDMAKALHIWGKDGDQNEDVIEKG